MGKKIKSTHTNPGGTQIDDERYDDGVVNDSLGTSDPADSTGLEDEEKNKESKHQPAKRPEGS